MNKIYLNDVSYRKASDEESVITLTADPMSVTTGVSWNHRHSGPPSCRCLICGELQYPDASIVNDGAAWLCEKCKSALKQVVDIVNS